MKTFIIISLIITMTACNHETNEFDASGTIEAEETIISSGAGGTLIQFDLQEGEVLTEGQYIGYVDTVQLYLKKKQILAQIKAGLSQRPDIGAQLAILEEQLKSAEKEKQRFTALVKAEAATQKQLDDLNAQTEILKKQIVAQRSSLGIATTGINEQTQPLEIQVEQLNDQLKKSRVVNPMKGTVLAKYAEANEMVTPGKPLYKIADLSTVILRAYLSGAQLSKLKLGQNVKVFTDDGPGKYKELTGRVTWISDQAEFTPKTIQTKEERANMVYAIKIITKNDGYLKLGMYAEVKF